MKSTKRKKKVQEEYIEPIAPPKPTIPNDILKAFLDRHVTVGDAVNITQVTDGFLWEKGGIERYRVNVWMKEEIEGAFCHRNYIGYTWFLHYNREEQTITDKTTGRVEEDKKEKSKLNGIANGSERIGKSFR
jgi:hypothetical protein